MSWYLFQTFQFELCIRFSICSFQGTLRKQNVSNALKACFHKDIFADFMAFAEQMALRSVSFEVTAWTRAGCFLIPRCIALHLWSGLFTKFVVLFSTWSITWSHGLGCLDIQLNNQSFLFNMRFSRYVSDWHFYQSSASSNLFKLTDHW